MTKKLILFDIDGTLIVSGGAGARAMTRAFEETWGLERRAAACGCRGPHGQHHPGGCAAGDGHVAEGEPLERFKRIYCGYLRAELLSGNGASPATATARGMGVRSACCPGFCRCSTRCRRVPDVSMALLTGNFPESAEIKLRHFDLWRYFEWGVYGNEATDRHDLLADRHPASPRPRRSLHRSRRCDHRRRHAARHQLRASRRGEGDRGGDRQLHPGRAERCRPDVLCPRPLGSRAVFRSSGVGKLSATGR